MWFLLTAVLTFDQMMGDDDLQAYCAAVIITLSLSSPPSALCGWLCHTFAVMYHCYYHRFSITAAWEPPPHTHTHTKRGHSREQLNAWRHTLDYPHTEPVHVKHSSQSKLRRILGVQEELETTAGDQSTSQRGRTSRERWHEDSSLWSILYSRKSGSDFRLHLVWCPLMDESMSSCPDSSRPRDPSDPWYSTSWACTCMGNKLTDADSLCSPHV